MKTLFCYYYNCIFIFWNYCIDPIRSKLVRLSPPPILGMPPRDTGDALYWGCPLGTAFSILLPFSWGRVLWSPCYPMYKKYCTFYNRRSNMINLWDNGSVGYKWSIASFHWIVFGQIFCDLILRCGTEFWVLEEFRGVGGNNGTSKYIYGWPEREGTSRKIHSVTLPRSPATVISTKEVPLGTKSRSAFGTLQYWTCHCEKLTRNYIPYDQCSSCSIEDCAQLH